MKVHDAAVQGLIVDEHGKPLGEATLEAGWRLDPTAEFAGRVMLGSAVTVGRDVHLGQESSFGSATCVEPGVYVGDWVSVGRDAWIGKAATLFSRAAIGRHAVIQQGVVIAPYVRIPDAAQVGGGRIIPTAHAIMAISPVGAHHRVVTVHGGPQGPEYSSGCQYSDVWQEFWDRIVYATDTTTDSARHYRELKRTFLAIGAVVQHAYDAAAERGVIARLREAAQRVRTEPRGSYVEPDFF